MLSGKISRQALKNAMHATLRFGNRTGYALRGIARSLVVRSVQFLAQHLHAPIKRLEQFAAVYRRFAVAAARSLQTRLTNRRKQKRSPSMKRSETDEVSLTEEQRLLLQQITMSPADDYYAVLGLRESSTTKDAKSSFRKRAMLVHPDKCSSPLAQDAFLRLQEAHETLSDTDRRRVYDRRRALGTFAYASTYPGYETHFDSVQNVREQTWRTFSSYGYHSPHHYH